MKLMAKGINFLAGNFLHGKNIFLSGSLAFLQRKRMIDKNYFDYIRLSTLELVSYEINNRNLKGSVAELGVYKGKFARFINQYFPERKFYLMDTFEGFDSRDISGEKKKNLTSGSQDFSDTSLESVLKRMPFPGKCIPVKGYFPESARGIDDQFVFVSLDADLFEPIYQGLKFFYPRLTPGGYLFIHDFNNEGYKGARMAVEQFCREENIGFIPIPDVNGTAIISK